MGQNEFAEVLSDYPSLLKGVSQLGATVPSDLQQQLLKNDSNIDSLILSAPPDSGKLLTLVLHSLRKLINEEQGSMLFIAHSKDFSQVITYHISLLTRIPLTNLYMQSKFQMSPRQILVANPSHANLLSREAKAAITTVVVPECDYLFAFNYGDHLNILATTLPNAVYKLSCVHRTEEIDSFKDTHMKHVSKVEYIPPHQNSVVKAEGNVTHFYTVGDKVFTAISLYVTLKFHLVSPKILILCESLKEVYRTLMFLERCEVANAAVYNHQNPLDLKFYTLSVWINGSTHILISTPALFSDLEQNVFKESCAKAYKRKKLDLVNLAAVIALNMSYIPNLQSLIKHFVGRPLIMTFLEQTQEEVSSLQQFLKGANEQYQSVGSKELPVTRKELEAFRYRINDVYMSLGPNRVQKAMELDFKKKLLRSPQMKAHFVSCEEERSALIKKINELRKSIEHNKISISNIVPQYLVPESLKASYEERTRMQRKSDKAKAPQHYEKVRRVLKYVEEEEENPDITDISRLKLISARKRWKILHGFKLKKRNLKNQKKGIFDTN